MNQNNISTLFGKYRCENKEKLLAELNINQTDEEELKYTLNKNQELVSSLFFNNATEWKQDFGLMDAYKKAWPYCDMDFLKQQKNRGYCDSLSKMISDWGKWSNSNDIWNWEDRL
ncbi:MAG: hypothetical protein J6C25_03205 [Treponema sp.]|nr:hypothetical protein [Treponema sp.]